jgi:hypothetical protein
MLISPILSNLNAGTNQIRFYAKGTSIIIGTMSDPSNSSTFTAFQTVTLSSSSVWNEYSVSFASYTGTDQYIAFKHPMASTYTYVYLDNINWETLPTCYKPTALTASSITASDAIIGWNRGGTETAWNVEYGPVGFTQGTGTIIPGVVDTTYALADLTAATTYSFYVQSDCGIANGQSTWAGPYNFTTPYSCPKPTVPTVANITANSADLGWTSNGTETAWIVYYKEATATNYTEVTGVTTNPYTLSGLTSATNYIFKVKANCSVSDTSYTSSTKTFTTNCNPEVAPTVVQDFSSYTGAAPQPVCWSEATGALTATTTLTGTTSKWTSSTGFANTGTNVGVKTNLYSTYNDWIISQPIDLGATPGLYRLKYTMAVTSYNGTTAQTTLGTHAVKVVVSTDGGSTWSDANVIKTYTGDGTYSNTGQIETINLTGYSGVVKFAFVQITSSTTPDIDFHIDDFKVEVIPTCQEPNTLTATSITTTDATLGWTAGGTETSWKVQYGLSGFALGTGTIVTTAANPLTLNSLTPSSAYQFYVQAVCSVTDQSPWAGPFSFSTLCGSVTTFPFAQSFDGTTFAPTCWSNTETDGGGTTSTWFRSTSGSNPTCTPHSGTGMAEFNCFSYSSGVKAELTTPALDLPSDGYQVEFWMYRDNGYSTDADLVNVYYNTTASATGGTLLGTINRNNTLAPAEATANQWYKYSFNMPVGSAGTNRYVIFEGVSAYGKNIFVDDIKVQVIPTCIEPLALTATDNTLTGATLGWAAGGTETAWNVQYGPAGFALGTGTIVSATTNSLVLSTLSSSSTYQFYVQSACSVSDLSTWAGPYTFSTLCGSISIPLAQNFDAVTAPSLPNCWSKYTSPSYTAQTVKTYTTSPFNAPNCVQLYSSGATVATDAPLLISPMISNLNTGNKQLKFYAKGASTNTSVIVGTMTDPADNTTFTPLTTITGLSTSDWTQYTVDLSTYTGTDQYLAFKHPLTTTYSYIYIDNITITIPSSAAEILTYTIPSQVSSTVNTGTATNGTVDVVMPYGTDVTALIPTITVSTAATINPASGVSQNFTSDVPYVVTAEDLTTTKTWTVHVTVETQACTTPSSLGSYDVLQTTANVHWTSAAPNFNVEYRVNGATAWTPVASNNDTLLLSGLTAGTLYDFRVQAICSATAGDTSNFTSVSNFTTLAVCSTPTALTATSIAQVSATLGWTSTAANFNVRYRTVGSTTWISTTATTTTLPISGLTPNTQYEFQVQATCSATPGDTSDWASVVTFTTLATPPCGTPTALAATSIAQTTATLGWTSTAANFNVRYRTVGSSTWTNTIASATTLPVAGLTANTQYEFQVQSVCSAIPGDTSAWATAVTFTTLAIPACATPTALAATSIAQTTATLGWTSTAANFNVRYRTVGSTTWTNATASATTLPVTGLTANTQYEFQVQAVCSATAGDTSAWATAATFTTLATATCPEPTALVVSAISEVGATLNWTVGGTETAWNIRYKKVADATYTNVANTSTKPYVLNGLQASTAYIWNVQAVCSGTLTSVWSADNTFTTTVGIENNSLSALKVYSYENQVNVINNGNLLVKEVVIYDVLGL